MFKTVVERAGLSSEFVIDSCGTGGGRENWNPLLTGTSREAGHIMKVGDTRPGPAAHAQDIMPQGLPCRR